MAFGFSPRYGQGYNLGDLDKEHFLVIAIEAALKLKWNVGFVSETGFICYTKFSWISWSEEITVQIDNCTASITSQCTSGQLFDWGKNKKNLKNLVAAIEEVKITLTQEVTENRWVELRGGYASKENDFLRKPLSPNRKNFTNFFLIFIPKKGYFISPILIVLNFLIFSAMVISGVHMLIPENQSLIEWGANFQPITLEGQWWRLLTSLFLHMGILHLLFNMFALVYIGQIIEPYLGKTRFLAAYLISGIAASMASLIWNNFTISAGASGAIFGMYGVFLALLTTNILENAIKKALTTGIAIFVGCNILFGMVPNSGIDNAAHIGGLLSGLFIGYFFVPSLKEFNNTKLKILSIGALTLLLLVSSFSVYRALPNDFSSYTKEMERFSSMEAMALEFISMPEGTPKENVLSEIKDRGIYYWNENIKLIDSFQDLNLPLPIQARNSLLKEYCELRIKTYLLIYRGIEEDSKQYEQEINDYNQKIEEIRKELL